MAIRNSQMHSRQFEVDETRRKLRNLGELKRHIEASLERLGAGAPAVGLPADNADAPNGDGGDRRATLLRSLEEIKREWVETENKLTASQEEMEHQEMVRTGYDRIPVAVGSGRGRNQVEHIRIVRAQRGNDG